LDNAELQALYRTGTSRRAGRDPGCPSSEDLLDVLTGRATSRERQALADHLMRCSDCAEEYRIAADLKPWAAAASDELAPAVEPRRWLDAFSWRHAAVATAALVLTVSGIALWQTMFPTPSPDRGPASATLSVEPLDRAVLPSPPDFLVWSPVPGADSYQAIVYDFESTPLWESPSIADPRVRLPEAIRGALLPGRPYYWRVIVSSGIDRRASDLFQFTVTTGQPVPPR
jgi:hypothetical protein